MIRSDSEYRNAVERLAAEQQRIKAQAKELKKMGLSAKQIKRVTDPLKSFHQQLAEEVENYERLKLREIQEIGNLRSLGHGLICIRIAQGLTQKQLADKLNVSESQVSRDERNEYHGITLERAAKVLEALGAGIRIDVDLKEAASA